MTERFPVALETSQTADKRATLNTKISKRQRYIQFVAWWQNIKISSGIEVSQWSKIYTSTTTQIHWKLVIGYNRAILIIIYKTKMNFDTYKTLPIIEPKKQKHSAGKVMATAFEQQFFYFYFTNLVEFLNFGMECYREYRIRYLRIQLRNTITWIVFFAAGNKMHIAHAQYKCTIWTKNFHFFWFSNTKMGTNSWSVFL